MKSPVPGWRKQKIERNKIGHIGEIISWTNISVAPPDFAYMTPYLVVLVKLEDGRLIYGQLVAVAQKDAQIGQRVVSILRKTIQAAPDAVVEYGLKFKLLS